MNRRTTRERARPAGSLLAAGLATAMLTGCPAADTDADRTGQAPRPSVTAGGNAAPTPQQPYDVLPGDKLGIIDFVELKLRNTCLAEAGYPQNLQTMPSRPNNPISFLLVSPASFGATSEDEARNKGFGHDYPGEPPPVVSFDQSYDRQLDRCTKVAHDRLGFDAKTVLTAYEDLTNQLAAYRREAEAQLPKDLPAKLLDCMAGKGYRADRTQFLRTPDPRLFGVPRGALDGEPTDNWTPQRKPGTVQVGPQRRPRTYRPTPEESALAVAWFQCSQATKRVELQLDACYTAQQRFVDRFETQITERNRQVEESAHKAATVAGL